MCRGCPIGTERPSPWRNRDLVRARHQCASMGVNTTGSAAHLGGSPGPVPFYLHEVAWGQSRSRGLIGQVVLVFGLSFVAYRPGCVGFWAVFRCYKAERWGLDSL